MIKLQDYLQDFTTHFGEQDQNMPWDIVSKTEDLVKEKILTLNGDYRIHGNVAIHKNAKVEEHVTMKGAIILCEGCFIAAHAYLRGGVYLAPEVVIGPGCEIKSSIIMNKSALAHFNFVGDSIIGSSVNMEAGSVIANHFNERQDKTIYILDNGIRSAITSRKFGALIGDAVRIGANAVLSPGTILKKYAVVKRLELVQQCV